MPTAIKEYDAHIDSKKRLTLRTARFSYYHVSELTDGKILLEPRELAVPFSVSENSLKMMDSAMENMKQGIASPPVDLSEFL